MRCASNSILLFEDDNNCLFEKWVETNKFTN